MSNQELNKPQNSSVDFLRDEYKYFTDSFWKNEEIGEKRLTVFITLVTAVIAGLVALHTKDGMIDKNHRFYVTICSLFALLLLGLATLLRMRQRDRVSDEYKRALDEVRDLFREMGNRLHAYQPFPKVGTRKRITGGYVQTVALINSLISAALIALLLRSINPPWIPVAAAILGLILSLVAQLYGLIKTLVVQLSPRYRKGAREHRESAEVRWFFDGSVPKAVIEWFGRGDVPPENESTREDVYLNMPGNDDLGIKLREGKLEIKRRKSHPNSERLCPNVEGRIEEWVKRGFNPDSGNNGEFSKLFTPDGTWISVKKTRRLKKYEVTTKGDVNAVDPAKLIEQGCTFELTEIKVHGHPWWSLGFESFGKANRVGNLRLVCKQVLSGEDLPKDFRGMEAKDSYGYPTWLSFVRAVLAVSPHGFVSSRK
jgi:hypothetical protein